MDNTTVYKCPNCGGSLEYNAETHILHCEDVYKRQALKSLQTDRM